MRHLWIVVLNIDHKKRIIEANSNAELYSLAAKQYVVEHNSSWPICGWSYRRLLADENPETAELERDD